MSLNAHLAAEIVDFLVELEDPTGEFFEVRFEITSHHERSARGLARALDSAPFKVAVERRHLGWLCIASVRCQPDYQQLEHCCRRLELLLSEFDCEFSGFRVVLPQAADIASDVIPLSSDSDDADWDTREEELPDAPQHLAKLLTHWPGLARLCEFERALQAYHSQQFDAAFDLLARLCDQLPEEQHTYLPLMGACRLHVGAVPEAVQLLEQAQVLIGIQSETSPFWSETQINLGLAYERLGQVPAAIEQFLMLSQSDPTSTAAHFHLARLHATQGDLDLALRHIRETLVLDDTSRCQFLVADEFESVRESSEFRALLGI